MLIRRAMHNLSARGFRRLPSFRGKGLLGVRLGELIGALPTDVVSLKDGSRLRLDSRSHTEHWTVWTGEYDSRLIDRLAHCLDRGSGVLDIGANVGFWSVQLGRRVQKLGGRVFAFEPMPANFRRLEENVALNGMGSTVKAVRCALGDEEATLRFAMDRRRGAVTGNAIMDGHAPADCPVDDIATVARLDRLALELPIDSCQLVKLDIEGAELLALRGGRDFFIRHRPIIYGEFNPVCMAVFGHTFADVLECIRPWAYRVFHEIRGARFVPVRDATAVTAESMGVLLVPEESPGSLVREMGVIQDD